MVHRRYTRVWIRFLPRAPLHRVLFHRHQTLDFRLLLQMFRTRTYPQNTHSITRWDV